MTAPRRDRDQLRRRRDRESMGRASRPAMARVGPMVAVPSLLREHGVDPSVLLAEFGLESRFLDDPDNLIPLAARTRFLDRCAEAAQCPHFGLLIGQRAGISAFGVVGFLIQSAPDVRAAIRIGAEHYRLQNPYAVTNFEERGRFASLSFASLQPGSADVTQLLDIAIATMFGILRTLCGNHFRPTEVRVAHARPRSIVPFRRFFQSPLSFDAPETGMVFDRHWLDRRLASADPLLHLMMQHRAAELEQLYGQDVASQVHRMLPALVAARSVSVRRTAENLGLTVRTLNRRLADEGTSFAELRDEVRYSIARQLLQGTRMPANRIADHLGFANPSAFTAAFLRWSGTGPASWRATQGMPGRDDAAASVP